MKYHLFQRAAEYDRAVLAGATPTIVYTRLNAHTGDMLRHDWRELAQWLFENCVEPYSTRYDTQGNYLAFVRREDAMLFKLVWI